jgi:2-polyprenyl-3-methyl-5-hydroxy-6-metoxy-1,4-benzoquinol methylase
MSVLIDIKMNIELVNIPCPRCNSTDVRIMFKGKDLLYNIPGEWFVSECNRCKLQFQNPRPQLKDFGCLYPTFYSPHLRTVKCDDLETVSAGFASFYQRHYRYNSNLMKTTGSNWKTWKIFDRYREWKSKIDLLPKFVNDGRLLEIGCAKGNRLMLLQGLGWRQLHGIELVSSIASQAEQKGIKVKYGTVEKEIESFPDDYFDVVIASMVLEHLENPFDTIKKIAKKLKPGGQFLFSTIVRNSVDAIIYNKYWAGYDFPRHMVYFLKTDLVSCLKEDFCKIKLLCQIAPIDYVRSANWKIQEKDGSAFDRVIIYLFNGMIGKSLCALFAMLGFGTRVSCECNKDSNRSISVTNK